MTESTEPQPTTEAGESTPNLRQQTLTGVRWMSLTRLVSETAGFISSIVLARLLAPAEFGQTAVAVFLTTIAGAVAQQGVGSFLVASRSPSESHRQAAMFTSMATGALGTVLTFALAMTVGRSVFGDRTAEFAAISSPVWLLVGMAAVPIAQLQRELSFGRLGVIESTASIVIPSVAIALAIAGLGGESLVIGGVVGMFFTTVLAWAFSRPPRPAWRPAETREILTFGAPAAGGSILYAAVRNVDYLLLAAFMPAFQVGLYMRAFALGSDYQSKISQILVNVAFPVLSRARHLSEVRRMRARMIRVHTSVIFPLLFGLIAVAPQFVPWMYGEPWAAAGSLTQILAIGGMIAAVGTGTGPLLMATGHPRALFVYNLVGLTLYTAAVLIAVPFGITAVCIAVVAARLIGFVSLQYLVVERKVGIPILETARDDVVPAMTAGLPQLAVTAVVLRLCMEAGLHAGPSMLIAGVLGLALNAAIMRRFFPATWADIRMLTAKLAAPRVRRAATRQLAAVRTRRA